jgi:hypothetical protein
MSATPQTAADKALEERDRLYRRYRKAKKAEFDGLCADPHWGERLRKFAATVNHFDIDDADQMIAYVRCHASWLRHEAPDDIRFAALQAIDHRIVRIRQRAGLAPFDDALPDEEPDVWQLCRKAINA